VAVSWAGSSVRADELNSSGPEKGPAERASEAAAKAPRYRVFSLRHISAREGRQYLSELGVGTISELPGANMLLVTGQSRELKKAGAVLGLVDSKQQYTMKTILPSWSMQGYTSIDRIAAGMEGIRIGTFSNPPAGIDQPKAIVDVHGDALVTISPVSQLDTIMSAFGKSPASPEEAILAHPRKAATGVVSQVPPALSLEMTRPEALVLPEEPAVEVPESAKGLDGAEPNEGLNAEIRELAAQPDVNAGETDRLFIRLLESLAEAEKKAGAKGPDSNELPIAVREIPQAAPPGEPNIVVAPQPTVPHEPNVAAAPEPIVRSEEPGVVPEPPAKELKDIALIAILKRLEALEAASKAPAEPRIEEVLVGIEPNQVSEAPEEVPEIEPNEIPEPVRKVVPKVMHPNEPNDVNQAVSKAAPVEAEPNDTLMVRLPENLPLVDFLGFVGEYLELDYLYDPKEVVGNVNLKLKGKLRGEIRVDALYPLLESVMQFHGFVMTRKVNLVTIRPKAKIDQVDPPMVSAGDDQPDTGNVAVTRVFELMHIDTGSAKNLLDQLKLGMSVTPIEATSTLIVTGYAYRMPRIEQLLKMVDLPGEPKQFTFRKLQYTMAEALAPKVKTLAEQLGTVSVTIAAAAPRAPTPPRRGTRPARPQPKGRTATPPPTAAAGKPTVYLEADQRTNRVLMIGLAEQLLVVNEIIDSLDVEQEDLRFLRLYEIKHVDAQEVRMKLEELGIVSASQRQTGRRTTQRERITPPRGRQQPAKSGQPARSTPTLTETAEGPLLEEPQVVIIETINSLLVNATPEQHVRIATIIGYVDNEAEVDVHPYTVYPLENQDPENLATVLNQLIQETITATARQDKDAKVRPTTTTTTTQRRPEEDIIIIPDKNTFSLIVYASKKNQQWIENLIKLLDRRRPQVLIDVTLVQIKKVDTFNMDLNILAAIPDAGYTSGVTPVNSDIFDLLTAPESDRSRFAEFALSPSLGGFQGFYGDEKISALLTAIQVKSYGRVMDRPKLLVNDNEPGTISTVETTYVERKSTSVIGTDNPQTTESTIFDDYSAGITLNITPHISEGDMLRLEITLNRSGFTSELGGDVPPDMQDANIETVVTVPDKSTIILGGIEQLQDNKGGEKIPFLGDLPFIGGLFRNVARDDRQNRTYVFVKAHILRPRADTVLDDLKQVSLRNREAFEALEAEMGAYQDWPGLKPYPLDPVRILEVD
jgi:type II secretory pathway component GspD/PulD (secretin)